jgi:hypothetical protein
MNLSKQARIIKYEPYIFQIQKKPYGKVENVIFDKNLNANKK